LLPETSPGRSADSGARTIELDPSFDKPHYQLISAKAGHFDVDEVLERYEARLAAAPADLREHRLLASAYLAARRFKDAAKLDRGGACTGAG
jgi:hypothetical protein